MNVELLEKIAEVIVNDPAHFDMNYFTHETACGTTHCIGGWAETISGVHDYEDYSGATALEMDGDQASRLFFADEWPERFQGEKDPWSPTPKQAAARIRHFIATDGAE